MLRMSGALLFDVQRISIHDGPGIRTVLFAKGCSLDCPWCQNPESKRPTPELALYAEACIGCGLCLPACVHGAVERPGAVDHARCINCGDCAAACPAGARRLVGRRFTIDEAVEACLADRAFYAASGGGVTFSGGEPVLQAGAMAAIARRLGASGIHTLLETAGGYPYERLAPLLDCVDRIYFDVKLPSPRVYREQTGRAGEMVFDTLKRLAERGADLEVRMPVLPGLNDSAAAVAELSGRLRALGIRRLQLLPYNPLWEAKLPRLDGRRTGPGLRPRSSLEEVAADFGRHGVAAVPVGASNQILADQQGSSQERASACEGGCITPGPRTTHGSTSSSRTRWSSCAAPQEEFPTCSSASPASSHPIRGSTCTASLSASTTWRPATTA
jgi:pyruvate formate lyase activating enzyme